MRALLTVLLWIFYGALVIGGAPWEVWACIGSMAFVAQMGWIFE